MEVQLQLFLTSPLDDSDWTASCLDCFSSSERTSSAHCYKARWVPVSVHTLWRRAESFMFLPGIEPWFLNWPSHSIVTVHLYHHSCFCPWNEFQFFMPLFVFSCYFLSGAHSGAVGGGPALQAGRLLVWFPMVSLEFFIDIILPAALWLWVRLSCNSNEYHECLRGVKAVSA